MRVIKNYPRLIRVDDVLRDISGVRADRDTQLVGRVIRAYERVMREGYAR